MPGVTPSGTTINLFDYWISSRDASDQSNPDDYENAGINKDSVLNFGQGMGTASRDQALGVGNVNSWTGNYNNSRLKPGPRTGIVSTSLGDDGYPVLSDVLGNQSLGYLFDPSNTSHQDYRASYTNVGGLLMVNEQGYYYYSCHDNFAEFVPDEEGGSGDFTLYEQGGVGSAGASPDGQFFPFNTGAQAFTEWRGDLQRRENFVSTNAEINHYFGMTMSTRFVQQYGGHTAAESDPDRQAVTYNFSGDDDVWVYIDGVLVGDLGGIHDKVSLEINFASGQVVVYSDGNNNNEFDDGALNGNTANAYQVSQWLEGGGDVYWQLTTLRQLFEAAGEGGAQSWNGDTFADDTLHTLDFFYLERGNTDSNMSLEYNLVTYAETDIVKVDQDDNRIDGARFALYDDANQDGQPDSETPICDVETGTDGTVVLVGENRKIVTVEGLFKEGHEYLVLCEEETPPGYRSTGNIRLRIDDLTPAGGGDPEYLLLSSSQWDAGAYALPRAMATAANQIETEDDHVYNIAPSAADRPEQFTMFAVVQKLVDGQWVSLYGDHLSGWQFAETAGVDGAIEAAGKTGAVFQIASSGAYQVLLDQIPGRIQNYQYFNAAGDYRVAYYFSTAASLEDATSRNTSLIRNTGEFDRQFSAHLYIPNTINRVAVQKLSDDGATPIDGATFALYAAGDVTVSDDGTWELREGAQPVRNGQSSSCVAETGTLTEEANGIDLAGAVAFAYLQPGEYWILETDAPEGYAANTAPVKVVVDETGVYADAGAADDGVEVVRGIGRLVRTMVQFATDDEVDSTLHDVVATPQIGTMADGSWTWNDAAGADPLHLRYSDQGEALLDYVAAEGSESSFKVDEGIPRLSVRQCTEHETQPRQELGDQDLTNLFTGTTVVQVTDARVGDFALSKTVDGADSSSDLADDLFTFDLSFELESASAYVDSLLPGSHPYRIAGSDGTVIEQGVVTIEETDAAAEGAPARYGVTSVDPDGGGASARFVESPDARSLSVQLRHGETLTISDLPVECEIAVEEQAAQEYGTPTVAINGAEPTEGATASDVRMVDLDGDGAGSAWGASVAYANTPLGSLAVSKTVTIEEGSGLAIDAERLFGFTVALSGADGEALGGVYAASGALDEDGSSVSSVSNGDVIYLRHNGTATITGLPAGAAFTVTETDCSGDGYTVSDNDQATGAGIASGSIPAKGTAQAAFENAYAVSSITSDIDVRKVVTGASADEDFSFEIALSAENQGPADGVTGFEGKTVTIGEGSLALGPGASSASADGSFDGVTFSKPGTYTFEIREANADRDPASGWTYDNDVPRKVVVEIVDNENGTLRVADIAYYDADGVGVGGDAPAATFTNSYEAEPATLEGETALGVVKRVVGAPTDEDFTFSLQLVDGDGTAVLADTDGDGAAAEAFPDDGLATTISEHFALVDGGDAKSASFGTLVFTKAGTYTFKVVETNEDPADARWSYANDPEDAREIVVEVKDGGQGRLTIDPVTGVAGNEPEFVNEYTPSDLPVGADAALAVVKSLEGWDLSGTDGDPNNFDFALTPIATDTEEGVTGSTADEAAAKIGHAAAAEIRFSNGSAERVDGVATDTMHPLEVGIKFGAADAGKTFSYRIEEIVPDPKAPGYSYDDTEHVVAYTVGYNDNGDLTVAATVDGQPVAAGEVPTVTFENGYRADPAGLTGSAVLSATKVVAGAPAPEDFTFSLVLSGGNGGAVKLGTGDAAVDFPADGVTATAKQGGYDGADGALGRQTASFPELSFTEAGDYVFTVTETTDDPDANSGWSYANGEENAKKIVVRVTDDGDGQLDATTTVDGADTNNPEFLNRYEPSFVVLDGDAVLGVVKRVAGSATGTDFSFTARFDEAASAEEAASAGMQAGVRDAIGGLDGNGELHASVSDDFGDAEGWSHAASFGEVSFAQVGVYVFTVTEDGADAAPDGWTYDASERRIVVTVMDDGFDGQLDATTMVDGSDTNNPEFLNVGRPAEEKSAFDADDPTTEIGGEPVGVGDTIRYEISWVNDAVDNEGAPTAASVVVTDAVPDGTELVDGSVSSGGVVADGAITWDLGEQEAGASGTVSFEVLVTEEAVAFDEVSNTATIEIGDDPHSTNTVTSEVEQGGLSISKQVLLVEGQGTAIDTAKEFVFTVVLRGEDGQPLQGAYDFSGTSDGTTSYSGTIQNGGTITLRHEGLVTVTGLPAGATYEVREADYASDGYVVFDNDPTTAPGIAGGEIAVGAPSRAAFSNTYDPADATASVSVRKTLLDRDWQTGDDFAFEIRAVSGELADGTPLDVADVPMPDDETATIGKDTLGHEATFGPISYDRAGTYEYEVVETAGDVAGIAYDGHVARVTVTVRDTSSDDGALDASVSYDNDEATTEEDREADDAATFTNAYKTGEPATHAPEIEKSIAGRDVALEAGAFFFTATATPVDDSAAGGVSPTEIHGMNAADGTVTFDESFSFSQTGTYEISVSEDVPSGDTADFSYDGHTLVYTVTVTDADPDTGVRDGVLRATVSGIDEGEASFVNFAPEKSVSDTAGEPADGAQVGDVLTYRISYRNTSDGVADVTVTDVLDEGLVYVADTADPAEGFSASDDGRTLTWALADVAVGEEGVVSFQARVTEDALEAGSVENSATVKVGDNPSVTTDTTETQVGVGALEFSKQVVSPGAGTTVDENRRFSFGVELAAADGSPLSGTYRYRVGDGEPVDLALDENGRATIELSHGDKASIEGLPDGATYRLTEADYSGEGYTVSDDDADSPDGEANGSISEGETSSAAFTNTYSTTEFTGVPVDFSLTKVLEGKDWSADDSFTFEIRAVAGMLADGTTVALEDVPMPASATTTVPAPDVEGDDTATFDFGEISYETPGTYEYEVREVEGDNDGIAYSDNVATVTVTVVDRRDGTLSASAEVRNATFTNVYDSTTPYEAVGGVDLTKTLTGRAAENGQFSFSIVPLDAASADKAGIPIDGATVSTPAAADGQSATATLFAGMTFSQADHGSTFRYEVRELGTAPGGYRYDTSVYEVAISPTDDGHGTITVKTEIVDSDGEHSSTTTSTKDAPATAVVPFYNTYEATGELGGSGSASISATKTLVGTDLAAGRFSFEVVDATGDVAATGTNGAAADGQPAAVTFGAISYTTASLKAAVAAGDAVPGTDDAGRATYEFAYQVVEVTDGLADEGITATTPSFPVTVLVTDNGDGTLGIAVTYPGGSGSLPFENAYRADDATVSLSGVKAIAVGSGDNAPTRADIAGKYTFTLTGVDESGAPAPLPGGATGSVSATNDATGSVDFGRVTYTTADFAGVEPGEDGTRSKTYTYTVTEAGSVAGVANDGSAKTFTVTVTDDGLGTLTAVTAPASSALFTFTNTYGVEPVSSSPTDTIDVTKTIDGRGLAAGEFTFSLTGEDGTVLTATNDADGAVVFEPIVFTAPGTYEYVLAEVRGDAGGVGYDTAAYRLTATVTDNGDGTMSVAWARADAEAGSETEDIAFANTYEPAATSVTLGATKTLEGRALEEGEFSFTLSDAQGTVLQTVTNDANGQIAFEPITFSEPGTYDYVITEQAGNAEGVTYDDASFGVTISVTDDGSGSLKAEVAYGDGVPAFTNVYSTTTNPPNPPTPTGTGGKGGLPQTGDVAPTVALACVAIGAAAIAGTAAIKRRDEAATAKAESGRHAAK